MRGKNFLVKFTIFIPDGLEGEVLENLQAIPGIGTVTMEPAQPGFNVVQGSRQAPHPLPTASETPVPFRPRRVDEDLGAGPT